MRFIFLSYDAFYFAMRFILIYLKLYLNDAFYLFILWNVLSYEMFYLMKCFILWNVLSYEMFYLMMCFVFIQSFIYSKLYLN